MALAVEMTSGEYGHLAGCRLADGAVLAVVSQKPQLIVVGLAPQRCEYRWRPSGAIFCQYIYKAPW